MGLQSFVRRPDVRARLRALRPNCPRKVRGLYKLEPGTNHRVLVGSAFDYLVGFEIKRLAPHAIVGAHGPRKKIAQLKQSPVHVPSAVLESIDKELKRLEAELEDYTVKRDVSEDDRKRIAYLTLKLAKLELSAIFDQPSKVLNYQADPRDIADLVAMLDVAPVESFAAASRILLWPSLPHAAPYVRSVDVDFVVGDRIVEVTTANSMTVHSYILDELMGQLFLTWKEHELDPTFPLITRVSLYCARHGYTLTLNAEDLIKHDSFDELYDWFFNTAAQVHNYSPPRKESEKSATSPVPRNSWWNWLSSLWTGKKS